jgi:spermidine/putrescine transport system permease protein
MVCADHIDAGSRMRVLKGLGHRGPSRPPVLLAIVTVLYLVWSLAPIITAMAFSFNHGPGVSVWDGFTTKWWIGRRSALLRSGTQLAIIQTFTLAIAATLIAVPLGAGVAVGVDRWRSRASSAASATMVLAFAIPEIVLGVMFYLLLTSVSRSLFDENFGWFGTKAQILALTTLQIPLAFIVVRAGTLLADRSQEEIAMDLGAPPVEAVRRALLPQVTPFLWGALILVFARSLEDFVVVNSVGNPDSATVTMLLYGSPGEQAGSPRLNVAATAVTVLSLLLFGITMKLLKTVRASRSLVQ